MKEDGEEGGGNRRRGGVALAVAASALVEEVILYVCDKYVKNSWIKLPGLGSSATPGTHPCALFICDIWPPMDAPKGRVMT